MTRPGIPREVSELAREIAHNSPYLDTESMIVRAILRDRERRAPGPTSYRVGGLTAHQKRVFDYLQAYIAEHGYSPSYDDIKTRFDLASKSGVHRVMHELEERGFIRMLPNRSRSITIIATPAS